MSPKAPHRWSKALLNYISLMEELYGEPEPAEKSSSLIRVIADKFWASLRQMVSDGEWPGEFEAEFEIPGPLKLIAGKWKISLEALFAEYDFDDGGLAGIIDFPVTQFPSGRPCLSPYPRLQRLLLCLSEDFGLVVVGFSGSFNLSRHCSVPDSTSGR